MVLILGRLVQSITGGNNYLAYGQNCFLECRSTGMLPNGKGQKYSVSDTKGSVRVGNRRMVTGQRVRESHVWKKIERYWKRETSKW